MCCNSSSDTDPADHTSFLMVKLMKASLNWLFLNDQHLLQLASGLTVVSEQRQTTHILALRTVCAKPDALTPGMSA